MVKKKKEDAVERNEHEEIFDTAEVETGLGTLSSNEEKQDVEVLPKVGSKEWTAYLLAKLDEDEKEDNNPTCDGLRRLTEEFVGPICYRHIKNNTPPGKENGVATVVVTVQVRVENPQHPAFKYDEETGTFAHIYEDDIADCGLHNCEAKYAAHASSTAATRAEARALRKILRLRKTLAAEEVSNVKSDFITPSWNPSDLIDETQVTILETICRRCNINVLEMINSGDKEYKDINQVSKSVATKIIQYLSDVQRGEKQKPSTVGNYQANWRTNNVES